MQRAPHNMHSSVLSFLSIYIYNIYPLFHMGRERAGRRKNYHSARAIMGNAYAPVERTACRHRARIHLSPPIRACGHTARDRPLLLPKICRRLNPGARIAGLSNTPSSGNRLLGQAKRPSLPMHPRSGGSTIRDRIQDHRDGPWVSPSRDGIGSATAPPSAKKSPLAGGPERSRLQRSSITAGDRAARSVVHGKPRMIRQATNTSGLWNIDRVYIFSKSGARTRGARLPHRIEIHAYHLTLSTRLLDKRVTVDYIPQSGEKIHRLLRWSISTVRTSTMIRGANRGAFG